ncbi:hypothetical protein [Mammaliicoccus sciuri]|uniref:hypothetical protein n=1 Tax=Mammaliicoccus sciuri TaxID=1296 RepID=UPI002DBF1AE9|nr:hypothetical protein [Mammaliicoccus sciuri]MEB8265365.1 hypothetical protein [Mammaliicoccus sciuri]
MASGKIKIKNFPDDVPFEKIPRELLQSCDTNSVHNKNMSLQAIGLLCNIRSYADTWDLHKTELYKRYAKNKEFSVRSAWDELVENNYIIQLKVRDGSKWVYIYYANVHPFTQEEIQEIERSEGGKTVKKFAAPYSKKETEKKDKQSDEKEQPSASSEDKSREVPIDLGDYFEGDEKSKRQSDDEEIKEVEVSNLPSQLQSYLMNFTLDELQIIKASLLIGKTIYNNSEPDVSKRLMLEDVEYELIAMLKRIKRKMYEKQEDIKDLDSYIKKSTLTVFERYALDTFEDIEV